MSSRKRFSLPAHGAIELVAGMSMMVAPALLPFGAAGLVTSAALGAVLTGMSLGLTGSPDGREPAWHRYFDSLFLLATGLAAFALAVAGDNAAALFLACVVGVEAVLNQTTRYATAT